MYENQTQNYDEKFTKNISYMIHLFPCHIGLIRLKGDNFVL